RLKGQRSQGSLSSPTAVGADQVLLDIVGAGHNGTYFYNQASIRMVAVSNWSDTQFGTKISFYTTKNNSLWMQERMVLSDQGYLGINQPNPQVPLHINYTNSTSNSTTGTAIFGELTDRHLNFNRFGIDAYDGTADGALLLNSSSAGGVVVGGFFSPSNLEITGYTRLGGGASVPNIKMKKLTGTTSGSEGGQVSIPHGIGSSDKILSVDVGVNALTDVYDPVNYNKFADREYNYNYNGSWIFVTNKAGNSADILNKPIKILIIYEE
ncbi:MAG: hypothetical protein QMB24_03605, partial [Spirosomataceae bacterium]